MRNRIVPIILSLLAASLAFLVGYRHCTHEPGTVDPYNPARVSAPPNQRPSESLAMSSEVASPIPAAPTPASEQLTTTDPSSRTASAAKSSENKNPAKDIEPRTSRSIHSSSPYPSSASASPNPGTPEYDIPVSSARRSMRERAARVRSANRPDMFGRPPSTVSGGVLNGKAISLPKPAYPANAKAANASGPVTVQIIIDESGNVISANAVSGHPLLRQSAVNAARQAKFSPTLLSGRPTRVTGVITYNFVAQ